MEGWREKEKGGEGESVRVGGGRAGGEGGGEVNLKVSPVLGEIL